MYLLKSTGERWSSQDPLYLLNNCISCRMEDPQSLFEARNLLLLAHHAFSTLPPVSECDTFCWASILPESDTFEVFGKWRLNKNLFSQSFVSAVPSLRMLETIIESASDLLPEIRVVHRQDTLLLFEMNASHNRPNAFNLSPINGGKNEFILTPGFHAEIESYEDVQPIAGMDTVLVKLKFVCDTGFFDSAPVFTILSQSVRESTNKGVTNSSAAVQEAVIISSKGMVSSSNGIDDDTEQTVQRLTEKSKSSKRMRSPTPGRRHHHKHSSRSQSADEAISPEVKEEAKEEVKDEVKDEVTEEDKTKERRRKKKSKKRKESPGGESGPSEDESGPGGESC